MSVYLDSVADWAAKEPQRIAFFNTRGEELTFGELQAQSDQLCAYLQKENPARKPVAIYGHKSPLMLVCMIGCMKAGCAFVPLDITFPDTRMDMILEQLEDSAVLATVETDVAFKYASKVISRSELVEILCGQEIDVCNTETDKDDPLYILFTSGSTGKPKGVMERFEVLDKCLEYFSKFNADVEGPQVHFNRAPFSFDLSFFNLLFTPACGHAMFAMETEAEASLALTFEGLKNSGMHIWFSTPTFLNVCLADPSFTPEMVGNLEKVIVIGETLHNATARDFLQRFPNVQLINAYGPTEAAVSVTDVVITQEMASSPEPLPVGMPGPCTELQICDPETGEELSAGTHGEICILGEQVGLGYFKLPEKTEATFITKKDHSGSSRRCFRTGDAGWLDEAGMLHFIGRFDFQVKVNGYRIELGEVESTLVGLPQVANACVIPVERKGSYVALCAHVVTADGIEGNRSLTKELKEALKVTLPGYMIPRTIKYHDELPLNINGKVDRKALENAAKEA